MPKPSIAKHPEKRKSQISFDGMRFPRLSSADGSEGGQQIKKSSAPVPTNRLPQPSFMK